MTKIVNPQDQVGRPLAPSEACILAVARPASLTLGGITAGSSYQGQSAADILTQLLFKYTAPVAALTATVQAPNNVRLFSTHHAYTINTDLSALISLNSIPIGNLTTLEFLYNGTTIRTVTVGQTLSQSYTHQLTFNEDTPKTVTATYGTRLTFTKDGVTTISTGPTVTVTFKFVHPTYVGIQDPNDEPSLGFDLVDHTALTDGSEIVVILGDEGYGILSVAIPQAPELIPTSIRDANGMDLIPAMDVATDATDTFGVPYRVYSFGNTYGYIGPCTIQF